MTENRNILTEDSVHGVEILGGDVDTLSSILVRENRQIRIADHSCEVTGEGSEVSVSFFGCEFVRVVEVVHGIGGGGEMVVEIGSGVFKLKRMVRAKVTVF